MSLINQMLQDLEQRSTGNLAGTGVHHQVRAVPERGGLHPAWWLVLALTLVLTGVLVWFWLRPPAPATAMQPLALKIAPDLSALPSPVAQAPIPLEPAPVNPSPSSVSLAPAPNSSDVAAPAADVRQGDAEAHPVKKRESAISPEPRPEPTPEAVAKPRSRADSGKEAATLQASGSTGEEASNAAKLTKHVKELTPSQLAENEYRQAVVVLQAGRNADALAMLEHALQLDAQNTAARQMLVGLLLQGKRMDEAVRRAQEGLALDPSQFGLAMILARTQVEQKDVKLALATLERSLPYATERADYQAFLAALLQRDKRDKEAIDHYVAALAKTPQNGVWWMGLGISLQAENRLPEAKEAFSRAKTSNTLTPELLAFVNQKLSQFH